MAKLFFLQGNSGSLAALCDIIMVPFLLIIIWRMCSSLYVPPSIASLSFPIYLIHSSIAYVCSAFYGVLHLSTGGTSFFLGVVSFVFSISLSVFIALVIKRLFPRFAIVLFGGRGVQTIGNRQFLWDA